MRCVAFSDTHGYHDYVNLPEGDVLLFGGDMCGRGRLNEVEAFGAYLARQPHRYKIVIAGNHDWPFQLESDAARKALPDDVIYLEDEAVEIEGRIFYGSPWQPEFGRWAFNLPRGAPLKAAWAKIPDETEVLITHGPPYGTLDRTSRRVLAGCDDLRARVKELTSLKVHLFGHIHEAYGRAEIEGVRFFNTSICDLAQRGAVNPPWVFEI